MGKAASAAVCRGFTLVESVAALVVLSVAVAAIALVVATLARGSADPVIQTQGLYLAESYLEEALLRPWADPDGVDEGCGVDRERWDDLADYSCLASPTAPTDPQGGTLAGLGAYGVSMSVGAPQAVAGVQARRVQVRVTHPRGLDLRLAAWRAQP